MPERKKNAAELAVEMKQITKRFGNFVANDSIDFDVRRGEVHALLGETAREKHADEPALRPLSSFFGDFHQW